VIPLFPPSYIFPPPFFLFRCVTRALKSRPSLRYDESMSRCFHPPGGESLWAFFSAFFEVLTHT